MKESTHPRNKVCKMRKVYSRVIGTMVHASHVDLCGQSVCLEFVFMHFTDVGEHMPEDHGMVLFLVFRKVLLYKPTCTL